ncbi:MAG: insulinase family protein [Clostridia bacterium]|nr:insulinase family protein [Clostridia bacterium]
MSIQKDLSSLGIKTKYIKSNKFKTVRMSVSFIAEADNFTLPASALLCKLLTRSTAKYPTHLELSRHLNMLYGARIFGGSAKMGNKVMLKFTAECLAPKYTPNNEDLISSCAALLEDAIFSPKLSGDGYDEEDFIIEKNQLLDTIDGRINSKRGYAVTRMLENMCKEDSFGIPTEGYREDAERLTSKAVREFFEDVLKTSPVILTMVGEGSPDVFFESISKKFENIGRTPVDIKPEFTPVSVDEVKTFSESMEVSQGKLVMGFRTSVSSLNQDNIPLRMMVDIFGGSPYSRLFTEVREKQSLCYYCTARLFAIKGIVCVDSGVEFDTVDKAKKGILDQLDIIKNGEFDDAIITASKMGLTDSVKSAYDSNAELEGWYLTRIFDKNPLTPEEFVERINKVSREEIIAAANTINLDTIYLLKGVEGDE